MSTRKQCAEPQPVANAATLDEGSIREIIERCKCKTRIKFQYGDGFFKPRMRGINYLELGRSEIISSPITILIEWLYLQWTRLRSFFRNLSKVLFPRYAQVWCDRVDSHLVGQTVFSGERGNGAPIHHLHLEFWGRTWLGAWRKLGETKSDKEGNFRLPFDLRQARRLWLRKVYFEIHTTTRVYFHESKPRFHFDIWSRRPIPKGDLIGMDYNLRTIRLDFWRYREDAHTPRAIVNKNGDEPERYSQGRIDALMEQIIPIELTKIKHLDQIELDPGSLTIPEIQQDYPLNLTTCIEKHLPGYTRGDDWFGERMMNGMNRGCFQPDPKRPGHYWIRYFGKCWYDSNEVYALPDVDILFTLKENGLPKPEEIHLTGRLSSHDHDFWKKRVYTPKDEPNWTYAKRAARVNGAFNTEVEEHFAGTHLNAEQFAVACYRNLKLNPVAALLMPHLKEVSLIDHVADRMLIGGYIASATALTKEGLEQRTRDIMGLQDWKGWQPMKALSQAHTCARAEALFWDVVGDYVDHFFEDWESEIKKHWFEIYCFSEDLVNHAVPVAFSAPQDAPPKSKKWKDLTDRRLKYYCQQYCFGSDPRSPRRQWPASCDFADHSRQIDP